MFKYFKREGGLKRYFVSNLRQRKFQQNICFHCLHSGKTKMVNFSSEKKNLKLKMWQQLMLLMWRGRKNCSNFSRLEVQKGLSSVFLPLCLCWVVWPDWAIYWTLGEFLKPLATINLPKSPTFLGNFYEGVKIYHFSSEIIFRQLL